MIWGSTASPRMFGFIMSRWSHSRRFCTLRFWGVCWITPAKSRRSFPNCHIFQILRWDASPRTLQSDRSENVGYPFMSTLGDNTPANFKRALAEMKAWLEISHTQPMPWAHTRRRHNATVRRWTPSCRALACADWPAAPARRIRARSTTCCGVDPAQIHCSRRMTSASVKTTGRLFRDIRPSCPPGTYGHLFAGHYTRGSPFFGFSWE